MVKMKIMMIAVSNDGGDSRRGDEGDKGDNIFNKLYKWLIR